MKKIPMFEPNFKITELPGEEMQVELKCDPSWFDVFEKDYEAEWYFYYYPEKKLTDVAITRYEGKMNIDGEECLVFSSDEGVQRCYVFRDDIIHCIRREINEEGETTVKEEYTLPRKLYIGFERKTKDGFKEETILLERVTDVVLVDFGAKKFKCLRYFWVSVPESTESTERIEAVETFIDSRGWNILFRRYNGRGWNNLKQLKDCPKIEFEGETFFLWYDCLPEYVINKGSQITTFYPSRRGRTTKKEETNYVRTSRKTT